MVSLFSLFIFLDEVPKDVESNVPYMDRGWCYFECMVCSMNSLARDLQWLSQDVKDAIARFRVLSAQFRDSGELEPLMHEFDRELKSKRFTNPKDAALVRGFFVSLARSQ